MIESKRYETSTVVILCSFLVSRMYQSIEYYRHLFNSLNGYLSEVDSVSYVFVLFIEYFFPVVISLMNSMLLPNFFTCGRSKWETQTLRKENPVTFVCPIFKLHDEENKMFPIWGTCLGFEVLLMLTRESTINMDSCKASNYATTLDFMFGTLDYLHIEFRTGSLFSHIADAADSQLLGSSLPLELKNALENEPITANFHDLCMRPEVKHLSFHLTLDVKFVSFESISWQIRFFQTSIDSYQWVLTWKARHSFQLSKVSTIMS